MVLLKKLLKSWFDEKKFQWERISRFSTMWYVHIFFIIHSVEIVATHTFWQKFRESYVFTRKLLKS